MIDKVAFVELAKDQLRDVYHTFGLRDTGSRAGRAFVELTAANNIRYLVVGMDQRQDYRVYAKIGKTMPDGQPLHKVPHPGTANDVVEFDLEFVMAQSAQSTEDFG